jgi:hypothetical protein
VCTRVYAKCTWLTVRSAHHGQFKVKWSQLLYGNVIHDASFEAFMAVMFQVYVFWVVTQCSVVVGYHRFRGQCCLHLHFTLKMDLWNFGILSLGVKRRGREADNSPPFRAVVKECVELYLHYPNTPSWCGAQFKKSTGTTYSNTTRRHNPEDLDLKHHRHESLKTRKWKNYFITYMLRVTVWEVGGTGSF